MTFSDSFIVSFSSSKSYWGNWFSRNCPRERWIGKIYFLWEWPGGFCVADTLAWLMLSSRAAGVRRKYNCISRSFETFGSFKGFKWMGRVLKLGKISSYFIKLSVREKEDIFSEISWLESSLNVLNISPACRFFYFTLM